MTALRIRYRSSHATVMLPAKRLAARSAVAMRNASRVLTSCRSLLALAGIGTFPVIDHADEAIVSRQGGAR